jgi:hypothetical protein
VSSFDMIPSQFSNEILSSSFSSNTFNKAGQLILGQTNGVKIDF